MLRLLPIKPGNIETTLKLEAKRAPYLGRLLEDPRVEIDQKDKDGWTALHLSLIHIFQMYEQKGLPHGFPLPALGPLLHFNQVQVQLCGIRTRHILGLSLIHI